MSTIRSIGKRVMSLCGGAAAALPDVAAVSSVWHDTLPLTHRSYPQATSLPPTPLELTFSFVQQTARRTNLEAAFCRCFASSNCFSSCSCSCIISVNRIPCTAACSFNRPCSAVAACSEAAAAAARAVATASAASAAAVHSLSRMRACCSCCAYEFAASLARPISSLLAVNSSSAWDQCLSHVVTIDHA
jgi:hypothetical protein